MTENGNGKRKSNPDKRALLLMETKAGTFQLVEVFEPNEDYASPVRACKAFLSEVARDQDNDLYRPLYDGKLFIAPVKGLEQVAIKTEPRIV